MARRRLIFRMPGAGQYGAQTTGGLTSHQRFARSEGERSRAHEEAERRKARTGQRSMLRERIAAQETEGRRVREAQTESERRRALTTLATAGGRYAGTAARRLLEGAAPRTRTARRTTQEVLAASRVSQPRIERQLAEQRRSRLIEGKEGPAGAILQATAGAPERQFTPEQLAAGGVGTMLRQESTPQVKGLSQLKELVSPAPAPEPTKPSAPAPQGPTSQQMPYLQRAYDDAREAAQGMTPQAIRTELTELEQFVNQAGPTQPGRQKAISRIATLRELLPAAEHFSHMQKVMQDATRDVSAETTAPIARTREAPPAEAEYDAMADADQFVERLQRELRQVEPGSPRAKQIEATLGDAQKLQRRIYAAAPPRRREPVEAQDQLAQAAGEKNELEALDRQIQRLRMREEEAGAPSPGAAPEQPGGVQPDPEWVARQRREAESFELGKRGKEAEIAATKGAETRARQRGEYETATRATPEEMAQERRLRLRGLETGAESAEQQLDRAKQDMRVAMKKFGLQEKEVDAKVALSKKQLDQLGQDIKTGKLQLDNLPALQKAQLDLLGSQRDKAKADAKRAVAEADVLARSTTLGPPLDEGASQRVANAAQAAANAMGDPEPGWSDTWQRWSNGVSAGARQAMSQFTIVTTPRERMDLAVALDALPSTQAWRTFLNEVDSGQETFGTAPSRLAQLGLIPAIGPMLVAYTKARKGGALNYSDRRSIEQGVEAIRGIIRTIDTSKAAPRARQ